MAVACGAGVFLLATAVLAVVLETAKPEWRDPEYGRRLRQLQKWQREAPNRPLVLFLGSSRIQMGISPAAMNLPDGPTDPLVYNFGMIGAQPRKVLLNLIRLKEAGVKPQAVLIELFPLWLGSSPEHEAEQLSRWSERLSIADLKRIEPYCGNMATIRRRWAASRVNAWSHFRLQLLSAWVPEWVPPALREDAGGDRLDAYGFLPHLARASQPHLLESARAHYFANSSRAVPVTEEADQAVQTLIAVCRDWGVDVAYLSTPESPAFRGFYTPRERAVAAAYKCQLSHGSRVDVLPAPEHLTEGDFADGHHLLRAGAEKYSRWLAETHLKPWLAQLRK